MIKPFFLASLLTCLSISAKAGSGSITPAPANSYGIKGLLHFTINFKYVPTQVDIDHVNRMVRDANDIICNATEGQIVFGKVTLTAGSVLEAQSDVWIHAQPGRAGLRLPFANGSELATMGHHVNMFAHDLEGDVLAHELAHLAFGLGDEYEECSRKIGKGIESGMPNHSLMEGRGSELTVPANHDLNKGARLPCPSPGNPNCSDNSGTFELAKLCESWDPNTQRYEATQQTLFHNGASDWETLLSNYPNLGLVMPNGLPQAEPPAVCDAFLNLVNQTHPSNAVVLVMDKSGSMSIQDVGSNATRLDFAKAAARVFLDLQKNRGLKVGLVSFNSEATQDVPLTLLTDQTQLGLQNPINNLTPMGATAIGKAGLLAYGLLNPTTAVTNPTVFLLSDGENNVAPKPEAVYPLLAQAGIRVFTVAVGNGADKNLLNNIAHTTGGEYVGTNKAADLPMLYAHLVVKHQGWSLPAQKQSDTLIENVLYSKLAMNIEKASRGELKFLISTDKPNATDYRPEYYFKTSGGMHRVSESQITRDAFFMILNYGLPTDIQYELFVPKMVNGNLTNPQMLCLRESSDADLFVSVYPQTVTKSNQPVMITPSVHYGKRLEDDKIVFTGKVIRPDGSEIRLQFEKDTLSQTIVAPFSEYNFKGTYKTVIEAQVPFNAAVAAGESIFNTGGTESEYVPPFERQATVNFFVQSGKTKCIDCYEPTKDCDADGIRNDIEKNLDSDKDGIPNRCDEDSDGDDIPDREEGVQDNNNNGIPDYLDPDISILKACNPTLYDLNLTVSPSHCKLSNGEIKATVRGGNLLEYHWYPNTHHHTATADSLSPALYNLTVVVDGQCILSKTAAVTCDVNKHKLSKSLETDYRIYPNPTTGQLNVEITDATILNIAIFNAVGTLVKNTSEQQSDFALLQLADLPNGIYWVQVNTSKGSVMEKLLVQH